VECGGWGFMAVWNSGFVSPGLCSGVSDIKLVYLYSTIKMMHGPINLRLSFFYYFVVLHVLPQYQIHYEVPWMMTIQSFPHTYCSVIFMLLVSSINISRRKVLKLIITASPHDLFLSSLFVAFFEKR